MLDYLLARTGSGSNLYPANQPQAEIWLLKRNQLRLLRETPFDPPHLNPSKASAGRSHCRNQEEKYSRPDRDGKLGTR